MTRRPDYIVATGDFITEWMEDEGINKAELARRLKVTRRHVSNRLSSKAPWRRPSAVTVEGTRD